MQAVPKREVAVEKVLGCFQHMGATKEQLAAERTRLQYDDGYLEDWMDSIIMEKIPTTPLWKKVVGKIKRLLA